MSKYKVGDTVWLVGEITSKSESDSLIDFVNGKRIWFQDYCLMNVEKTYSDGLDDAWELARKVNAMSEDEFDKCFNFDWQCTTDFTYQEILAMVEAYEESKAIKVGDVVYAQGIKGVVIDDCTDNSDDTCYVFCENGNVEDWKFVDLKKTGRHIDIEHLFKQIRGDE